MIMLKITAIWIVIISAIFIFGFIIGKILEDKK